MRGQVLGLVDVCICVSEGVKRGRGAYSLLSNFSGIVF